MFLRLGLVVLSLVAIAQGTPSSGMLRIVGGHTAPNHKYPYQISFRHYKHGHFCSGSILNKRWILTAAHCLEKKNVRTFTVSVGTNFLSERGTVYEPRLIILHELWTMPPHFDIGLVQLNRDIVFTNYVQPIALPTRDLPFYRRPTGIVAGWGNLWWWGPTPQVLQEIQLNILSTRDCRKYIPDVTSHQICTFNKPGEGICHGDSGGPLAVDGVQVGIASYGLPPCGTNPDVWTRVFSYRDWIIRHIQRYNRG